MDRGRCVGHVLDEDVIPDRKSRATSSIDDAVIQGQGKGQVKKHAGPKDKGTGKDNKSQSDKTVERKGTLPENYRFMCEGYRGTLRPNGSPAIARRFSNKVQTFFRRVFIVP